MSSNNDSQNFNQSNNETANSVFTKFESRDVNETPPAETPPQGTDQKSEDDAMHVDCEQKHEHQRQISQSSASQLLNSYNEAHFLFANSSGYNPSAIIAA